MIKREKLPSLHCSWEDGGFPIVSRFRSPNFLRFLWWENKIHYILKKNLVTVRWYSEQRCLLPTLRTQVPFLAPHCWRRDPTPYRCTDTCVHSDTHTQSDESLRRCSTLLEKKHPSHYLWLACMTMLVRWLPVISSLTFGESLTCPSRPSGWLSHCHMCACSPTWMSVALTRPLFLHV